MYFLATLAFLAVYFTLPEAITTRPETGPNRRGSRRRKDFAARYCLLAAGAGSFMAG